MIANEATLLEWSKDTMKASCKFSFEVFTNRGRLYVMLCKPCLDAKKKIGTTRQPKIAPFTHMHKLIFF